MARPRTFSRLWIQLAPYNGGVVLGYIKRDVPRKFIFPDYPADTGKIAIGCTDLGQCSYFTQSGGAYLHVGKRRNEMQRMIVFIPQKFVMPLITTVIAFNREHGTQRDVDNCIIWLDAESLKEEWHE